MKTPIALALLLLAPAARAAEFAVTPGPDSKVVFVSEATMETFEGKTNKLQGSLKLDPAALGDSITVHFEVDLASLDTGMARRNQHMRERHLETARFPKAVFDGATVRGPAGVKLEPGKTVTCNLTGTFTLHGVSRRIDLTAEAALVAGSPARIAFKTTFPVALTDYQISRPEFLFLKLAEVQQVKVSAVAVATP